MQRPQFGSALAVVLMLMMTLSILITQSLTQKRGGGKNEKKSKTGSGVILGVIGIYLMIPCCSPYLLHVQRMDGCDANRIHTPRICGNIFRRSILDVNRQDDFDFHSSDYLMYTGSSPGDVCCGGILSLAG